MTFKMLINLTQVRTSPEFLKLVVSKKDFTELRKEKYCAGSSYFHYAVGMFDSECSGGERFSLL